jgi:transketolase
MKFDQTTLRETTPRLRCNILRMISEAGSGHPGGSLSAIDVIAYLYFHRMKIDPANPRWEERDRFVLSKGHCCPAHYVVLAARGYFPEETLWTLRAIDSPLQGHPDMNKTAGVDMTSGSLGQGFSCAAGIALGGKLNRKDYQVYVMLGDGEIQAGVVWEAAMAAAHNGLDNLVAIVDYNKYQVDGATSDIMNIEPVLAKWRSFGWAAVETDGHDFAQIHDAFEQVMAMDGRPRVIVAHTVKGKGVRDMEGNVAWHGKAPTRQQAAGYIKEIMAGAEVRDGS